MRCGETFLIRFVTGSIAPRATRRYLIYSEADLEVFRPARAHFAAIGGEIWQGGGDFLHAKFNPNRCNGWGIVAPKLKFLLRFDQNVEYKRPAGGIPCAIFIKFAEFVPRFRMR